MKHITIDIHFFRDLIDKGLRQVSHVNTLDQLADILTKALPRSRFDLLCSKISIVDWTSILQGVLRNILINHLPKLILPDLGIPWLIICN